MSLRDVVRRDLRDAFRTRGGTWSVLRVLLLTIVPGVYVLITLSGGGESRLRQLFAFLAILAGRPPPSDPEVLVLGLGLILGLSLPLVAVMDASDAVVAEREARTMKILLTLPNSRSDVFFGKVVARSALVLAPLLVGVAAVAGVAASLPGDVPIGRLVGLALLSSLLVVCFVALGVSGSTLTTGHRRAVFLGLSGYFGLAWFWRVGQFVALYATTRRLVPAGAFPAWFAATERLSPVWAYEAALELLLEPGVTQPFVSRAPAGAVYGNPWVPVLVIIGWLLGLLLVGYLAFERADLG